MTFTFQDLLTIYPDRFWIEFSQKERDRAWQHVQNQTYSNTAARYRAFLNHLCLNSLLTELKQNTDLKNSIESSFPPDNFPYLWEFIDGTSLTLGETRMVLIPSDKSSLSELRIPQEWVDIPNWVGNYYLAVQLNLEECWMQVWGYATHEQIRKTGNYDRMDRTYCLDREDLIEDLNVMWVARELLPLKQPEVKSLPVLSSSQTEEFLKKLSKPTAYSPRLDLPFETWAALISSAENLQNLYQLRLKHFQNETLEFKQSPANNLSLWLQNIFELGWQSFETLLGTEYSSVSVSFRSDLGLNQVRVKGAKLIDLGMQLKEKNVILLVGLTPEVDDKVSIRVQLYPASEETYLPSNVKLILVSRSGAILQEIESRSQDCSIQLKRFKSPLGNRFSIQVALGDVRIKEDFWLEPLVS
jgi:Protein of unknown function (DUF1822)